MILRLFFKRFGLLSQAEAQAEMDSNYGSWKNFTKLNILVALCFLLVAPPCYAVSSANIPLDSPIYSYIEKLIGMKLISSDVRGIRPYSKAEAVRMLQEAEKKIASDQAYVPALAKALVTRLHELLPRETILMEHPDEKPQLWDYNPIASTRMRYLYLNGEPRDYNRDSVDHANQSFFGFGNVRPMKPGVVHTTGTEGTPLLENNNGVIHPHGNSGELRWAAEGYLSDKVTTLLEPALFSAPGDYKVRLNRGYLKLGGGGLELLAGRDENWFAPGYRGSTVLTNNAQNFDQIKLSSPEPINSAWLKKWVGNLKYSLIVSRFDETGSGDSLRRPYFIGAKLAIKPWDWFEYGFNFVRQQGGPGFKTPVHFPGELFGGNYNNHNNSIAGIDLRFRAPWLANTEFYAEYSGEDNYHGILPIVESYVAGIFVPCITSECRDDFRFEYFSGSVMLYGDWKFPAGYVYHNMTPGHSQGTNSQEFFGRYTHWFSVRNHIALEYFYTERGRTNRAAGQVMESKHAGRAFWDLPLRDDVDVRMNYGIEMINNLNLAEGTSRTNQIYMLELRYRY